MTILVIDTSTERGVIALGDGSSCYYKEELPVGLRNSTLLMSAIQRGIEACRDTYAPLSAIAVAHGPGSYTGLRVGMAAAKGLALGLDIPVVGFSSLTGYVGNERGVYASVIDARQGEAFVALVSRESTGVHPLVEDCLIAYSDFEALVGSMERVLRVIVTPDRSRVIKGLTPFGLEERWLVEERAPDVHYLLQHAAEKVLHSEIEPVRLRYLKKTQAEIEREKVEAN